MAAVPSAQIRRSLVVPEERNRSLVAGLIASFLAAVVAIDALIAYGLYEAVNALVA